MSLKTGLRKEEDSWKISSSVQSQQREKFKLQMFYVRFKSLQACPTLCNPMDCSPPGASVHGVLWARVLEWVAMSFSRESSQPRDQTWVSHVSCTSRQVLKHQHRLGLTTVCGHLPFSSTFSSSSDSSQSETSFSFLCLPITGIGRRKKK